MDRVLSVLLGPETVMALVTLAVFAICASLPRDDARRVRRTERMLWSVPLLAITLVFLTLLVPGNANGLWLARAILASFIGTTIFTLRILQSLGPGARGQDAGFIMALSIAGILTALGTAASGMMILAQTAPAFAEWLRLNPLLGIVLALAAAVPVAIVLAVVLSFGGGLLLGLWYWFRR